MSKNQNLHAAKRNKDDEFYTCQFDILQEINHYIDQFENKVIYLPCDDAGDELWNVPEDHCLEYQGSQFWYVFAQQFAQYKLKKLICTCYRKDGLGVKLTIDSKDLVTAEDKRWPYAKAKRELLTGDGDFRSEECEKFFDECDIVITNPPFSIIDEFVNVIMKHEKQFLIMGPMNAICYKDVFRYIKEDKLWQGYSHPKKFRQPDGSFKQFGNINWYTNLFVKSHYEEFHAYKKYKGNEEDYPYYDNYNAIEVSKMVDIPKDFDGVMGIPISSFDKLNSKQFELIWTTDRGGDGMLEEYKKPYDRWDAPVVNGCGKYKRIFVRWKNVDLSL